MSLPLQSGLITARIPPQRSLRNRGREGRYGSRQTWTALSPVVQQLHHRHLFSPGEQREEPRCQDTSIADSPHMIINQEFSDTIQSLPWAEQETLQSTKKISSLETNNTDTDEEDQDTNRSPNPLLSSSREELEASIITASDFW